MTENIGRQPPTDFVNTLPGQLQLYSSNAVHFRPREFQKVKEGAEKRRDFKFNPCTGCFVLRTYEIRTFSTMQVTSHRTKCTIAKQPASVSINKY